MFEAKLVMSGRLGRTPTLEEIGQWVGVAAGLAKVPDPSMVRKWFQGHVPRGLPVMEALAGVMGVDPGWLYFYPASKAPAPRASSGQDAVHPEFDKGLEEISEEIESGAAPPVRPDATTAEEVIGAQSSAAQPGKSKRGVSA
jgi:hypothetical protein